MISAATRWLATVGVMWIAGAASALAQEPEELVRWSFRMLYAEELKAPPVGYRGFAETDELRFVFSLVNDSGTTSLRIDQPRLRATFWLNMRRGGEIPLGVRWLHEVSSSETFKWTPIGPDESVVVAPRNSVTWMVVVARVDGQPFSAGEYLMSLGTVNTRSAVQRDDGGPWTGRLPERAEGGELAIHIRPPSSNAERARMHGIAGAIADAQGALEEALEEYSRLFELDPTNGRTRELLGYANMKLGRYREAISHFEQLFAGRTEDPVLSQVLAQAYVNAGDEGNALRVLRMSGRPENRISAEMILLRRYARESMASRSLAHGKPMSGRIP
jgi:hypothetical protein